MDDVDFGLNKLLLLLIQNIIDVLSSSDTKKKTETDTREAYG